MSIREKKHTEPIKKWPKAKNNKTITKRKPTKKTQKCKKQITTKV